MNKAPGIASFLCLSILAIQTSAQQSDLIDAVQIEDEAGFDQIAQDELARRRHTCEREMEDATSFLERTLVEQDWREELAWEQCRAAVETEQVESNDALRATWQRLSGTDKHLSDPALLRFRTALGALIRAEDLSLRADEIAERRHKVLQEVLAQLTTDTPDNRLLQSHLQWLIEHEQAPELVALMHREWSKPNLYLDIPGSTLLKVTETPISQTEPISEKKDGVRTRGTALITGVAYIAPQASNQLHVEFQGHVDSHIYGSKGPAFFRLQGDSSLTARKRVHLSKERFDAWNAQTEVCSTLRTACVGSKLKGLLGQKIKKIARKKIAKSRPSSSRDLSRGIAKGFVKEFDKVVVEELAKARRDLNDNLMIPLVRLDADPHRMEFFSSEDNLQVLMQVETPLGLAADSPPPVVADSHTLAVRLHESLPNRLAEQALGGKTVNVTELVAELTEGKVGALEAAHLDKDETHTSGEEDETSLEIEFASENPLMVEFEGDEMILLLNGRNFMIDDWVGSAMSVEIRYEVSASDEAFALALNPKIKITPLHRGGSLRFFSQRSVLRRRLVEELPKRQELNHITLSSPGDALGELQVSTMAMRDGWMTALLDPEKK